MAKSENQKMKTLYVAKYLWENSDENHPVKVHGSYENRDEKSIIFYLQDECGIDADGIYNLIKRILR